MKALNNFHLTMMLIVATAGAGLAQSDRLRLTNVTEFDAKVTDLAKKVNEDMSVFGRQASFKPVDGIDSFGHGEHLKLEDDAFVTEQYGILSRQFRNKGLIYETNLRTTADGAVHISADQRGNGVTAGPTLVFKRGKYATTITESQSRTSNEDLIRGYGLIYRDWTYKRLGLRDKLEFLFYRYRGNEGRNNELSLGLRIGKKSFWTGKLRK